MPSIEDNDGGFILPHLTALQFILQLRECVKNSLACRSAIPKVNEVFLSNTEVALQKRLKVVCVLDCIFKFFEGLSILVDADCNTIDIRKRKRSCDPSVSHPS